MTTHILGRNAEKAYTVPGNGNPTTAQNFRTILSEIHDKIFIPESALATVPAGISPEEVQGVADDNRSLIIPGMWVDIPPHRYYLDVKGIGSRSPMFGFSNLVKPHRCTPHPGGTIMEHWRQKTHTKPVMTGETWFGSSPYGAQGEAASVDSIKITEMAGRGDMPTSINGFWICPVLAFNEMPPWLINAFKDSYWYRKYNAGWFQQLRLIPSDVRMYFHSDATLGINPQQVLSAFGIETGDDMDDFIDNFVSSGIAALTLGARTVKKTENSYSLLDYDDVWLDKDSVIAPNGTIHFADIDDIEWIECTDEEKTRLRILRQFERNYYEFMFGLDVILSQKDRMSGNQPSITERREDAAARYETALVADKTVRTERSDRGLDMIVKPQVTGLGEVTIRLIDFQKRETDGGTYGL